VSVTLSCDVYRDPDESGSAVIILAVGAPMEPAELEESDASACPARWRRRAAARPCWQARCAQPWTCCTRVSAGQDSNDPHTAASP
jgi:hypothetical protein